MVLAFDGVEFDDGANMAHRECQSLQCWVYGATRSAPRLKEVDKRKSVGGDDILEISNLHSALFALRPQNPRHGERMGDRY